MEQDAIIREMMLAGWNGDSDRIATIERYEIGPCSTQEKFTDSLRRELGTTVFNALKLEFCYQDVYIDIPVQVAGRTMQAISQAIDARHRRTVGYVTHSHGRLIFASEGRRLSAAGQLSEAY